jgi:hypothetical protein
VVLIAVAQAFRERCSHVDRARTRASVLPPLVLGTVRPRGLTASEARVALQRAWADVTLVSDWAPGRAPGRVHGVPSLDTHVYSALLVIERRQHARLEAASDASGDARFRLGWGGRLWVTSLRVQLALFWNPCAHDERRDSAIERGRSTMRWYVSRNGETVGPVEEPQVVAWVQAGMWDAMIRDEAGGQWVPISHSPFAPQWRPAPPAPAPVPQKTPEDRVRRRRSRRIWIGAVTTLCVAMSVLIYRSGRLRSKLIRGLEVAEFTEIKMPLGISDFDFVARYEGHLTRGKFRCNVLTHSCDFSANIERKNTRKRAADTEADHNWTPDPDVRTFYSITQGREVPTLTDNTGDTLNIAFYDVAGWSLVDFAKKRSNPNAWKLHAETAGSNCRRDRFAPTSEPLRTGYFRLAGGPLDGLILHEFQYSDGSCNLHFATMEYAKLEGWGVL